MYHLCARCSAFKPKANCVQVDSPFKKNLQVWKKASLKASLIRLMAWLPAYEQDLQSASQAPTVGPGKI